MPLQGSTLCTILPAIGLALSMAYPNAAVGHTFGELIWVDQEIPDFLLGGWNGSCSVEFHGRCPTLTENPSCYPLSGRKNSRTSLIRSSGSSIGAKCPPDGIVVQRFKL